MLRECHPINCGRTSHYIGKVGKRYHKSDYAGPVSDSMRMMYARIGWTKALTEDEIDGRLRQCAPRAPKMGGCLSNPNPNTSARVSSSSSSWPASCSSATETSESLCMGCTKATSRNDFYPTNDKSHLVCSHCGAVSAQLHIATDRERNCARDEDKTTHADKPQHQDTDPFSKPGMLATERRRMAERAAASSYISQRTRVKYGMGYAQERGNRNAASEQIRLLRQDMSTKDFNKGNHIIVEIEKLFLPLDPMDDAVKRYCRKEAARLWHEAVRHSSICCSDERCQLWLKDRTVSCIAQLSLACSLDNLAQGVDHIDGIAHGHIISLVTKLQRQGPTSVSCGYRAVAQVVRRLVANTGPNPLPKCVTIPSPAQSAASSSCSFVNGGSSNSMRPSPLSSLASAPPLQPSGSASDMDDSAAEILQIRNAISKVARHMSCAQRVQRAALIAIQDQCFLSTALTLKSLSSSELAYCALELANKKVTGRGFAESARPGKLNAGRITMAVRSLGNVFPSVEEVVCKQDDDDDLF